MASDIEYAALAVKKAILEKFYRTDLKSLEMVAGEKLIRLFHEGRVAEGTRDELLSALRKAADYEGYWMVLADEGRCRPSP